MPHQSEGASTVLFWHYIDGIRRHGWQVQHVVLVDDDHAKQGDVDSYRRGMTVLGVDVVVCRAPAFVDDGFAASTVRRDAIAPGRAATEAFGPDVVLSFDLLAARATAGLVGRRVVWLGDLNFQTIWHHARYLAREAPWMGWPRLPVAAARSAIWAWVYRQALKGSRVIVASYSSERVLARIGVRATYLPYPWPSSAPGDRVAWEEPDVPTYLFMGTLQALGSRSAFHFLLEGLYPRLQRRWSRFRIIVAGRGDPPAWAVALLDQMPEVDLVGFVEDLDALLGQVHAVLAPIDVPVGNRSRIVTAMAAGALVIAHRNASLGNPDLVDGETCFLAATPADFEDRMARAVENRGEVAGIIARARRLYESRFEPTVAVAALVDELSAAAGS